MATIQKKWGEVVGAYNLAYEIVKNAEQQLQQIQNLEKEGKSKEELKAKLEENQKIKALMTDLRSVYTELISHLQPTIDKHNNKVQEINIEFALETEAAPAKGDKPAVMKLLLDEKGDYCYDRQGEIGRRNAIKEFNLTATQVPILEIATSLTEKHELFEGILVFKAAKKPALSPVKGAKK